MSNATPRTVPKSTSTSLLKVGQVPKPMVAGLRRHPALPAPMSGVPSHAIGAPDAQAEGLRLHMMLDQTPALLVLSDYEPSFRALWPQRFSQASRVGWCLAGEHKPGQVLAELVAAGG